MSELDQVLVDAVESGSVPFAVAAVADRHGVVWQGSAGNATESQLAAQDTLFRLFSMTKAIGGCAAMILIDRNLLSLDTPVASVLPEFSEIQVLTKMGPNGPELRPPARPVTLRHMLTHTAGFAYEAWSPKQALWQMITGAAHPVTGTLASLRSPLMFEPGEDFAYGIGFDWLGPIIEKLDGRKVDRFCKEEIFDPLGMNDTAFEPDFARDRLATNRIRCVGGEFANFEISPAAHPEVYGLGQALYSTAPDYLRFLRMVLNRGELDGHRVISTEAVELMMADQMGGLSMPVMKSIAPLMSANVDLCPGTRKTWSAGFMRNETDIPGMRSAGSLTWAGFLNTHYWVDPVKDVAAVFMTQSLPYCDPIVMDSYATFERAVYRAVDSASGLRSLEQADTAAHSLNATI